MNRQKSACEKSNKKWIVLEYIVILSLIMPVCMVSLYALPCSDDFSTAAGVRKELEVGGTYFLTAVKYIQNYYKSMGGYYFSTFINIFMSPFLRWGIWGIRIFVLAINIIFHFSLYVLVKTAINLFFEKVDKKWYLFIYILLLFAFTNMEVYAETLTWYTGMAAYVLVVAFMFWGIICFLKGMHQNKKIWFIGASVMGFLVSGGALNVTALNCGIYLVISLLAWTFYSKGKESLMCFGSALAGAVINVSAPGNFVRHGGSLGGSNILGALKMALYQVWKSMQHLFFETPYALILIILLLIVFRLSVPRKQFKYSLPGVVTCIVIAGCVIVNFPVYLGYGSYFPGRCCWVQDTTIYLATYVLVFYWAGWLKRHNLQIELKKEVVFCLAISGGLYLCMLGNVRSLDDYPTVQMVKQLTNGELREFDHFWMGVIEEIEESNDKDVVLKRENRTRNAFIMDPDIYDWTEDYTNKTVAQYYNKDSVAVWYQN